MFKTRKPIPKNESSLDPDPNDSERRESTCRRVSFDTKYLGLGKCIDRRKGVRRQADKFDEEAYERLCQERLGPGWL